LTAPKAEVLIVAAKVLVVQVDVEQLGSFQGDEVAFELPGLGIYIARNVYR
jgi:hypothetical protein